MKTAGLHHITAVTKDPQTNIDFYQQVLGQRLVKTTVNFDEPSTYHLYYGDYTGIPGTAMTFFGWLNSVQGKVGTGETQAVAYTIPQQSVSYWNARLKQLGFSPERVETRFGQDVIPFTDPEGMRLELASKTPPAPPMPIWMGCRSSLAAVTSINSSRSHAWRKRLPSLKACRRMFALAFTPGWDTPSTRMRSCRSTPC